MIPPAASVPFGGLARSDTTVGAEVFTAMDSKLWVAPARFAGTPCAASTMLAPVGSNTIAPPGWTLTRATGAIDSQVRPSESLSIGTDGTVVGNGAQPRTVDGSSRTGNYSYLLGARSSNETTTGTDLIQLSRTIAVPATNPGVLNFHFRTQGWDSNDNGQATNYDYLRARLIDGAATQEIVGPLANNYVTAAAISGIWSPGGLASDGTNIYATSGNAPGGTATWGGQEAVLRFQAGPTFSNTAANYFAPSNWQEMDTTDKDMCGAGPVLLDVPGATPSKLVLGMSKEGVAHVLDRNNLGGIGTGDGGTGEGLVSRLVIGGEIHTAAATYTTRLGTYVVLNGDTGGIDCPGATAGSLVAIKITPTAPPKIEVAWCATPPGPGAPMVTTTDGQNETLVWLSGSSKLQAFDGDTGARVFQGGGAAEAMGNVRHWVPPIAAKGRVLIAGDGAVYAFTVK